MVCFNLNAQLNISGTEYVLLGDLSTQYNSHRSDAERFPELNWNEINAGNFTSLVKAFVRDAVTHDAEIDLSDRHILRIVPSSNWDYINTNPMLQPAASSYNSSDGGYEIRINRYWWDWISFTYPEDSGIIKIKLLYHELGHGLLHAGHLCEQYGLHRAIMSTTTCQVNRGGPGFTETKYRLDTIEGWIDHLFERILTLSQSQVAKSRGPSVIHCN